MDGSLEITEPCICTSVFPVLCTCLCVFASLYMPAIYEASSGDHDEFDDSVCVRADRPRFHCLRSHYAQLHARNVTVVCTVRHNPEPSQLYVTWDRGDRPRRVDACRRGDGEHYRLLKSVCITANQQSVRSYAQGGLEGGGWGDNSVCTEGKSSLAYSV